MEKTKQQLLEVLRGVEPVPGTQIQTGQVDSQLNPRDMDTSTTEERKEHAAELAS